MSHEVPQVLCVYILKWSTKDHCIFITMTTAHQKLLYMLYTVLKREHTLFFSKKAITQVQFGSC